MLITEYQRRISGVWQIIRQYYWFPVEIPPTETGQASGLQKPRHACPGCREKFTAISIRQHYCSGGSLSWPRIKKRYPNRLTNTEQDSIINT